MIYHLLRGGYPHSFAKTLPIDFLRYCGDVEQTFIFYFNDGNFFDFQQYHSKIMTLDNDHIILNEYPLLRQVSRLNVRNRFWDVILRIYNKSLRICSSLCYRDTDKYRDLFRIKDTDTLIVHGEPTSFSESLKNYIGTHVKKYYWVCWGGVNINESVFYDKCKMAICLTRYDKEILEKKSIFSIVSPYIFVLPKDMVKNNSYSTQILIGNSSSFIPEYKKMFSKIKSLESNVTFMCPYGTNFEYRDNFEREAIKNLKNVFFWNDILPIEDYIHKLAEYKVYVCPIAYRQTGLAAIYYALSMGIKIFLDGINYEWCKTLGFEVYRFSEFMREDTDSILHYEPVVREYNVQKSKEVFDINSQANRWRKIMLE